MQPKPDNIVPMPALKKFEPPTLEIVLLNGSKIGLPEMECMKFHAHYDSVDWFVGRKRMVRWLAALSGWKYRWMERTGGRASGPPEPKQPSGIDKVVMSRELETVQTKMNSISRSYEAHQSWTKEDREKWTVLKARKILLKNRLGIET